MDLLKMRRDSVRSPGFLFYLWGAKRIILLFSLKKNPLIHNSSDSRFPLLLSHRSLNLHRLQGAFRGRRGSSPFRIARILCRVAITCLRSRGWTVWNRDIPSGIYSTFPPVTSFPVISSMQNAMQAIRNRSAAYVPNGIAPAARMMEQVPSSVIRSTIPTMPCFSEITRTSD